MSGRDLLIDHIDGILFAAVVVKNKIDMLYHDAQPFSATGYGAICAGRITKIDTALDCAFVGIDNNITGMLNLNGASFNAGQDIIVAVTAAARHEDTTDTQKMPRLSTHITQDISGSIPPAPAVIIPAPHAVARAMADFGVDGFDHIYVASRDTFDMVTTSAPALATSKRLRLFKPEKTATQSLFDAFDVMDDIDRLGTPVIPLDGGGSIVIETTTAATIIDVNQGADKTPAAANMQALVESLRHMRLRNLSGIVLIDFIDTPQKNARQILIDAATAQTAKDPATTQIHGFTRLGFMEITRKRQTPAYHETIKSF